MPEEASVASGVHDLMLSNRRGPARAVCFVPLSMMEPSYVEVHGEARGRRLHMRSPLLVTAARD